MTRITPNGKIVRYYNFFQSYVLNPASEHETAFASALSSYEIFCAAVRENERAQILHRKCSWLSASHVIYITIFDTVKYSIVGNDDKKGLPFKNKVTFTNENDLRFDIDGYKVYDFFQCSSFWFASFGFATSELRVLQFAQMQK